MLTLIPCTPGLVSIKASGKAEKQDEHLYDELKRLRKENARLKEEHAILKKAAAFFARESL